MGTAVLLSNACRVGRQSFIRCCASCKNSRLPFAVIFGSSACTVALTSPCNPSVMGCIAVRGAPNTGNDAMANEKR